MPRRARTAAPRRRTAAVSTRDRIFTAAAELFAARGFDGAKVDRIAEKAGLNKAMLYYHFPGKAALYRTVLLDMFGAVSRAVNAIHHAGGPPDDQLRGFIRAIAREGAARPHFPPIWLREVAEGGRHLDPGIVAEIRNVLTVLGQIHLAGERAGLFRHVPPFLTQVSIVGPLLFFLASTPIRQRFAPKTPGAGASLTIADLIAHVEAMTLGALVPRQFSVRRKQRGGPASVPQTAPRPSGTRGTRLPPRRSRR